MRAECPAALRLPPLFEARALPQGGAKQLQAIRHADHGMGGPPALAPAWRRRPVARGQVGQMPANATQESSGQIF